jgi:hypothetical protein
MQPNAAGMSHDIEHSKVSLFQIANKSTAAGNLGNVSSDYWGSGVCRLQRRLLV